MVFILTVTNVISKIDPAPTKKYHHDIPVRKAKPDNHDCPITHINGTPITIATNTSIVNSADSNLMMPISDAPKTFRTLISFILRSAVNAVSPYNPRHEITIANTAKILANMDTFCSDAYNAL